MHIMTRLHWSVMPVSFAPEVVLEFRAAQLERHQAEREFMAAWDTPAESSTAAYMESAWLAESWAYAAAVAVYGT
ncbi:hypothetical protein DMA15_03855 [Streptomyces sp. WAC 01529]|uniref:hypothetical protein n=1 Tax=Streptomyces sp. WAC 01529 TaxID=2203205 RepID=UPI000F6C10A8|nr:hypothetical protein [Streptomyces sp. WAC 01529]AZM51828.1 hypothetical protein DMA15_03855 [Streptomyces sp. WAC 01529]